MEKMKIQILFVDDTAQVRDVIGKLLECIGYEVEIAVNGRDALQKLNDSKPNLILTDYEMRVNKDAIDEVELCIAMSEVTKGKVPIVIASCKDPVDIRHELKDRVPSVRAIILKPLRIKVLRSTIDGALNDAQA